MAGRQTLAWARVKIVADASGLAKDVQKQTERALGDAGAKGGTAFGKRLRKQIDDDTKLILAEFRRDPRWGPALGEAGQRGGEEAGKRLRKQVDDDTQALLSEFRRDKRWGPALGEAGEKGGEAAGKRMRDQVTDDVKKMLDDFRTDNRWGPAMAEAGSKGGKAAGKRLSEEVTDEAAKAGTKAGRKLADNLGDTLNEALRALKVKEIDLDANPKKALAQIELTKVKLKELSDGATTAKVKIQVEDTRSLLDKLKKQFSQAGKDAGGLFGLMAGIPMRKQLIGAVVGLVVVLSPLIAGIIEGAVVGAVGLGGIIGGVALAAKDPAIKDWATRIGTTFMEAIGRGASVMKGPILTALGFVEAAASRASSSIAQIFANVSPAVVGLTQSLIRAGDALLDSFVVATAKSGPAIGALGDMISQVSSALSDMIVRFSEDSKNGATALNDLTSAVTGIINTTTNLLRALASINNARHSFEAWIQQGRYWVEDESALSDHMKHFGVQLDITADGYKKGSAEADAFRRKEQGVATAQDLLILSGQKALTSTTLLEQAQKRAATAAESVKTAQTAVKTAQDALKVSIDSLGGSTSAEVTRAKNLETAMDNLYGATRRNADANQEYEKTWDELSASVKENGHSLDVHSKAGRDNRTAMIKLLEANNDLYFAQIADGMAVDKAREKHQRRKEEIIKETGKLHLNKTATDKMIETYGRIQPKKATELVLNGMAKIARALYDLYLFQRSLATGKSVSSVEQTLRTGSDAGPAKRLGGYAAGGQVPGWSPNDHADNIPARLTAKEWVHPVDAVDYYGRSFMKAVQKKQFPRDMAGYAFGGGVAPVDTSKKWPFHTDVGGTRIPSKAEVISKIMVAGGPVGGGSFPGALNWARSQVGKPYIWASSGPGGYDCSGFMSAIINYLRGRPLYHRLFSTGDAGGSTLAGLTRGKVSPFMIGVFRGNPGHTAGTLNGVNVESSGSVGVRVGGSARGARSSMFNMHYGFARGGQVGDAPFDLLNPRGEQYDSRLADMLGLGRFDRGGWWANNTLGVNTSGAAEHVTTGPDRDEQTELLTRILAVLQALAPDIGDTLGRALLGSVPAGRVAARQIGRRAYA